jgi:hypothetical protein
MQVRHENGEPIRHFKREAVNEELPKFVNYKFKHKP